MTFLERFDAEWAPKLAHRRDGFRKLFEQLLASRRDYHRIVETGCVRSEDWAGDGRSTVLFDRFVESAGGELLSIDLDPAACAYASAQVGPRSRVVAGDSVLVLGQVAGERASAGDVIDLLYLDSLDWEAGNPALSAEHALRELEAARPALKRGSVVAIDDAFHSLTGLPRADGSYEVLRDLGVAGKAALVAPFCRELGLPLLLAGYQRAWIWV